tara:strand:- start:36 stop:863 length:828 start_codon:yes stop_codon:yes gene_type:complete
MALVANFAQKYGPWALIAGASEGIGLSFAEQLAGQGINLILISRREDLLHEKAEAIKVKFAVEIDVEAIDLTKPNLYEKINKIAQSREIGMMIYNAGAMHGASLFHEQDLSLSMKLVDLNCRGPLILSHIVGGKMRERGHGGIILLGSLVGLGGGAYIAGYAASKAYDQVLGQSLWAELKPYGVDVMVLTAGATDTPAMAKSGVQFGEFGVPMDPGDVVREGLENLGKGPTWVPGEQNRANAAMFKEAPLEVIIDAMTQGSMMLYNLPAPGPQTD